MKKLFKWLFSKTIVKHVGFQASTGGMEKHDEFIEWVNKEGVEIINSFVFYYQYSDSHKPKEIHYVIKYKQ